MWKRVHRGLTLTFHLAGINNQNFLMRDEETGSFWQQISGIAISGPLAGAQLELVHSDELSFALWKTEQPSGTVLADLSRDAALYAKPDWESEIAKMPTVIATTGLPARELMLGIETGGASRAYQRSDVMARKLILDRVGNTALLLIVGPDNTSVRAFRRPGDTEFYRVTDSDGEALMMDANGARWNFRGCQTTAPTVCLERLDVIQDYWFDWRNYHPQTTLFRLRAQ